MYRDLIQLMANLLALLSTTIWCFMAMFLVQMLIMIYISDVDAKSVESVVLATMDRTLGEGFFPSMGPGVMQSFATPMPAESSRNVGISMDLVPLERTVQVAISRYFPPFEIQGFLIHEKFGIVGFSKERLKFNIQLRPGVVEFMDFYTTNFEVVSWNIEVEERTNAQYNRLQKACPLLGPNHPKFARLRCDILTAMNQYTKKHDISLKHLSQLFDNARALGSIPPNNNNTLFIDPFPRRCILSDPYNGFHPTHFFWNSENDKPGLPYLLRIVQPFF
jgi:hypothetical protein